MRVLVTGGAGFIGSHAVDALLARGYRVRILDALRPPVHEGSLPSYVPVGVADVMLRDVRERAAWEEALRGVDAVFHLAAYQDYLPDFSTFVHVNAVSTALLYEVVVAERLPVQKIVVASSQSVYGEGKYICRSCPSSAASGGPRDPVRFPPPRDDEQLGSAQWDVMCPECGASMEAQWTDESMAGAHNAYGISKYAQELLALGLGRRYGIPTVCLRYSIVQGPRQSFRNAYSGVLRIFAQRILTGSPPICYEDGQQLRDYVSVHDVTRANMLVLEDSRADFQVFNVGGSRQVTVVDYARLIGERIGRAIEPQIPGTYRFGDMRHIFSDVTRLKALGWNPTVPMVEIVDEYLDWVRTQPAFGDHSPEAQDRMQSLGVLRKIRVR